MKAVVILGLLFLVASQTSFAQVSDNWAFGSMPVGSKIVFQKTLVIPWFDRTPITFHSNDTQTCRLVFSAPTNEASLIFSAGSKLKVTGICGASDGEKATLSNKHVIMTCSGHPNIGVINAETEFRILKIVVPPQSAQNVNSLTPCPID